MHEKKVNDELKKQLYCTVCTKERRTRVSLECGHYIQCCACTLNSCCKCGTQSDTFQVKLDYDSPTNFDMPLSPLATGDRWHHGMFAFNGSIVYIS